MGTNDQRLWLVIGYAADAERAVHFIDIFVELGAKRRVFDVVNGPVKTVLFAVNGHTGPSCSEMGMIIRAKK